MKTYFIKITNLSNGNSYLGELCGIKDEVIYACTTKNLSVLAPLPTNEMLDFNREFRYRDDCNVDIEIVGVCAHNSLIEGITRKLLKKKYKIAHYKNV